MVLCAAKALNALLRLSNNDGDSLVKIYNSDKDFLTLVLSLGYTSTMRHKVEDTKRASVYFPVMLLAKLQESAREHRRSFNQEVMWRIEQSYAKDAMPLPRQLERKRRESSVQIE